MSKSDLFGEVLGYILCPAYLEEFPETLLSFPVKEIVDVNVDDEEDYVRGEWPIFDTREKAFHECVRENLGAIVINDAIPLPGKRVRWYGVFAITKPKAIVSRFSFPDLVPFSRNGIGEVEIEHSHVVAWVQPGGAEKKLDIPTEEARTASMERRHELCGTAPVQRAKKAATKAQARNKPTGKKRKLATA